MIPYLMELRSCLLHCQGAKVHSGCSVVVYRMRKTEQLAPNMQQSAEDLLDL